VQSTHAALIGILLNVVRHMLPKEQLFCTLLHCHLAWVAHVQLI
jgi:hypothetical protein